MVDDLLATVDECEKQFCILNDTYEYHYCDINEFTVIEIEDLCHNGAYEIPDNVEACVDQDCT